MYYSFVIDVNRAYNDYDYNKWYWRNSIVILNQGGDTVKNEELVKEIELVEISQILDRGIDDMESGRELPVDDAFDMVDRLIERRKLANIEY